MHEPTVTPTSVGVRYGFIAGFSLIIVSLIFMLLERSTNSTLAQVLSFLILGGGIVAAYLYFKEHNHSYMSYGQGLGIGAILGSIAGVLGGVFSAIYTTFIDNTILEKAMEMEVQKMEERGLSDEQIEKAVEVAQMFSGPLAMIILSILLYTIGAFFLSLIIAAIMKRNRPEFE
ncbi:hypothetical protein DC20_22190 (plasmid) [Rufibacter tibetensis]|uniref:DUF4199 domain-containing protein n=2 Tax=Rufibacter tibetensis TaxID=512763 RepID=A0A0P0C9I6_9BACT|nr:hypothetical protein DC20_22190 [Rufibacter tibetensis]